MHLILTLLTAVTISGLHGQFLAPGNEIKVPRPVYRFLPLPGDINALRAQLNGQGSQGFRFAGARTFISALAFEQGHLYVGSEIENLQYEYRVENQPDSLAESTALLNQLGSASFRFVAPVNAGSSLVNVFVRQIGSTQTFAYLQDPRLESEEDFLTLANQRGQDGWEYLGPSFTRLANSVDLEFFELFTRQIDSLDTFSARSAPSSTVRSQAEQTLVQFGSGGFRFVGPRDFEQGARFLFVRNLRQNLRFRYDLVTNRTTSAAFLQQAADRSLADLYLSAELPLQGFSLNLYSFASNLPRRPRNGQLLIIAPNELRFEPTTPGNYELQESIDLQNWSEIVTRRSFRGEPLRLILPTSPPLRYFRVLGP